MAASGKGGLDFGLSGNLGYFIFDRTAFSINASFVLGNINQYQLGPSLSYYIGPIAGWMIIPAYQVNRYWQSGASRAKGWIHGPGVSAQTRISEKLYFGARFDYIYFIPESGSQDADWYLNPAISYYF